MVDDPADSDPLTAGASKCSFSHAKVSSVVPRSERMKCLYVGWRTVAAANCGMADPPLGNLSFRSSLSLVAKFLY